MPEDKDDCRSALKAVSLSVTVEQAQLTLIAARSGVPMTLITLSVSLRRRLCSRCVQMRVRGCTSVLEYAMQMSVLALLLARRIRF